MMAQIKKVINIEVPVDERLYRWPEHADETGDQEESLLEGPLNNPKEKSV